MTKHFIGHLSYFSFCHFKVFHNFSLQSPLLVIRIILSYSLLLLLSRFSRVRLCATPSMAADQAPPSLGFSRHEYWSGLPFPSPMHEGEKWKWSRSVVSYSERPHGLQPTRLLHPRDFPGKSTGVGCHCYSIGMTYSISHILWLIYCDSYLYWKRRERKNNSAPVRTEKKTDWVLNPESSIMKGLGISEFLWLGQVQDCEGFCVSPKWVISLITRTW